MSIYDKLVSFSKKASDTSSVLVFTKTTKNVEIGIREDMSDRRLVMVSASVGTFKRTFNHTIASPWDYETALDEVETVLHMNINSDLDIFDDVSEALKYGVEVSLKFKFSDA